MSLSAQAYNSLRGPALTVMVMDMVREHHQNNLQITSRQIARKLAMHHHLNTEQFGLLYARIRHAIRHMSDAGMVQLQPGYDKISQVRLLYITIPTPSSPCSD